MSVDSAIEQVQSVVSTATGIRHAPEDPPEKFAAFPVVVTYPFSGTYKSDTTKTSVHSLAMYVLVARKDLPRDVAKSLPLGDAVAHTLIDAYRAGTLTEIEAMQSVDYTFGDIIWAGIPCLGFAFRLTGVKLHGV